MMEFTPDSLRAIAPHWSLAGDDQLLNLLQNTHQKIISKCQDVNSKLEQMASALDEASINLQNVNNKFMALSNSQFIESRVYDDDAELTTDIQTVQNIPQQSSTDDVSLLKESLAILEQFHETAEIIDDSESDSDAEISVVLKPKDLYSQRPLPHIIGSQAWKNKWHAGLLVEDSDSDSMTSKRSDIDQYSDSEEERPPGEDQTLSERSSSGGDAAPPAPRPADVAAELARRLAGDVLPIAQEVEDLPPAPPVSKKIYKPEQPATTAIFSDEPPPLSDATDQSSDEDIFAEINKHKPYAQRSSSAGKLAEDLFNFNEPEVQEGDIFSDFAPTRTMNVAKQKSTLFEGESEPELFAEPDKRQTNETNEVSSKKPVGGISLFGSNKGTESIGAAILKRNQRKSSTSGDDSGSDDNKKRISEKPKIATTRDNESKPVINKEFGETDKSTAKKEKDIFDDLFSKSEKKPVQTTKAPVKVTPSKEKEKTNVKDLFSDNIFDDIDDIFTTNVKIPTKKSNEKSIFDDDDLFSDVAIVKSTNQIKENINKDTGSKDNKINVKDSKETKNNKSIFDSDDELFSGITTPISKVCESHDAKNELDNTPIDNSLKAMTVSNIKNPAEITKERNLFDDSPLITKPEPKIQVKSKSIFDSDNDDDIFAKIKPKDKTENVVESGKNDKQTIDNTDIFAEKIENDNKNSLSTGTLKKEKDFVASPSIFEEDEIDDLFVAANKLKESKYGNDPKLNIENISTIDEEPSITKTHAVTNIDTNKNDNLHKNKPFGSYDEIPHIATKKDLNQKEEKSSPAKDIFDKNLVEDELFTATKDLTKTNVSKQLPETEIIESSQDVSEDLNEQKITEPVIIPETQSVDVQNQEININLDKSQAIKAANSLGKEIEKELVLDDPIESIEQKDTTIDTKVPVSSADIFDNIFSEPPAFEKPAESKKSKNINALFDDDSDDESLFFKKDDVISDEKPDIFSKNANFGIFVDEPPAIDVDFTPRSTKNTDANDDDFFDSAPKHKDKMQSTIPKNDREDIFSSLTKNNSNLLENVIDKNNDDESFGAVMKKDILPESSKLNDNLDSIVPKMQENVPDSVKVTNENITNVPSTETLIASVRLEKNKDSFLPVIDKSTDDIVIKSSKIVDSDEELFASLPNLPKSSQTRDTFKSERNDLKSNVEESKTDNFDDIFKSELPQKDTEIKKIGKLNTKNFNINVNALIPGASPKKIPKERKGEQSSEIEEPKMVKIIPDVDFEHKVTKNKDVANPNVDELDQTDFIHKSTINRNENIEREQNEQKPPKSIKFDESSESGVLDNKASKQRPRIQIKRRPSTRKARHEAVRKSAIDFGDDTDNSSSFDEPKPVIIKEIEHKNVNIKDNVFDKENLSLNTEEGIKSPLESSDNNNRTEITNEQINNTQKEITTPAKSDIFEDMLANLPPNKITETLPSKEITESDQNLGKKTQTTTKIVYILNDEDIFNTDSQTNKHTNIIEANSQSIDSNVIKSSEGIQTLGKAYKETENIDKKNVTSKATKEIKNQGNTTPQIESKTKGLFDDSDEELFGGIKPVKSGKVTIFDSDSEEDLFGGQKSSEKKHKEVRNKEVKEKKSVVKGSLFGDDDDDDDLFGISLKKDSVPKVPTPSTSKETTTVITSKTAEPVFNDPLSMLGDDD